MPEAELSQGDTPKSPIGPPIVKFEGTFLYFILLLIFCILIFYLCHSIYFDVLSKSIDPLSDIGLT